MLSIDTTFGTLFMCHITSHHTASLYLSVNDVLQPLILWFEGNGTGQLLGARRGSPQCQSCAFLQHRPHTNSSTNSLSALLQAAF